MDDGGADRLIPGLAAGRPEALAELYDRYGERLYRVALRMLGRPEDAEDAVQDLFAAMARSSGQLNGVRDLPAYLFASVRRAAGRVAERRSRQPAASAAAERAADEGVEARPGGDERGEGLGRALRALPAEQREVIALKIDAELTFAQVGWVLGISPNTAASRYRYALEKLRAALEARKP